MARAPSTRRSRIGFPLPRTARPGPSLPSLLRRRPLLPRQARARRNPIPLVVGVVVALALAGLGVRQWLVRARPRVERQRADPGRRDSGAAARERHFVARVLVKGEPARVKAGRPWSCSMTGIWSPGSPRPMPISPPREAAVRSPGRDGQAAARAGRGAPTMEADAEATAWKTDADLARYRSLAQQSVISAQELDAAEAAARGANAKLDAARGRVHAAEAGLTFASARVASARAARDQAALQLSYTRLVAPSSGVVSQQGRRGRPVLVQVGQPLHGRRAARRRVGGGEPEGDRGRRT